MCSQHLTQDKQFVPARREMANLAPNTVETPESNTGAAQSDSESDSESEFGIRNRSWAAKTATEAPLGSFRTAANTYPVSGELFRRVSNAQLMRVPSRGSSCAAPAVDAVCAACGESAQCSPYSSPYLLTLNPYWVQLRGAAIVSVML